MTYQNEGGIWEIIEPLRVVAPARAKSNARKKQAPAFPTEYIPHYVFNTDHLWLIRSPGFDPHCEFPDYCGRRTFWNRFDPAFAAGVHATIFDKALGDLVPPDAISSMKRKSLWLDVNILSYDPRDHFDNAFIDEGWGQVNQRLAAFQSDHSDWASLGAAAHGIADFYAHSSYAHFANLQNPADPDGSLAVYAPDVPLAASPEYDATPPDPSLPPFDLTSGRFSTNASLWNGSSQQAAALWSGKIISGRYAQKYDPLATFWEGWTSLPSAVVSTPGFALRGSLPHHDEIAVDSQTMGKRHKLYSQNSSGPSDRQAYANQFRWRMNTAIEHIRQVYLNLTE
ncbi:MAG TPA: hypothetical protein VJA21_26620 [Verrucomicrobiae bacterium]